MKAHEKQKRPGYAVPMPPLSEAHKARFARIALDEVRRDRTADGGIGTLMEKRLHATVKRYLCDNQRYHEVGIANTRYVADVRVGNLIYEVQTGSFAPMRDKIGHYLSATDCTVTVVHPVPSVKWITWMDPVTGEATPRRRSPQKGHAGDLIAMMYPLIPFLKDPRLRFHLLLLEVEDFRLLSNRPGGKKGSRRFERIPLSLLGEAELATPADFASFIPPELPSHFTVSEFSALSGHRGRDAYSAVRVLAALGFFEEGERKGRSMGWVRKDLPASC